MKAAHALDKLLGRRHSPNFIRKRKKKISEKTGPTWRHSKPKKKIIFQKEKGHKNNNILYKLAREAHVKKSLNNNNQISIGE